MNESDFKPEDTAFLLSRSLDETLPEEARQSLRAALSDSKSLRADADGLRAVHRLTRRWAAGTPKMDWKRFEACVLGAVADDAEASDSQNLDDLVARWAAQGPRFDDDTFDESFVEGVFARTGAAPGLSIPGPKRLFARPLLAAAAALAMALSAGFWYKAAHRPIVRVAIGPSATGVVAADDVSSRPRVVVAFFKERGKPRSTGVPGIGFGAVWADTGRGFAADVPPT